MGSIVKFKRQAKAKPMAMGRKQRRSAVKLNKALAPIELKFFDTAVNFTFDTTLEVPATGQWALVPQGDTQSTRDGRLARIKSIQFRGSLTGPSATSSEGAFYLWVVQDRQANGAAAAATDVFDGTAGDRALVNLNNSKRFKLLKKLVIAPNEVGYTMNRGGAAEGICWTVDFYIPCDILMDWNSTTGAITEITSNNIFIVAGSRVANNDDLYTLSGNARIRFYG